MPGIPGVDPGDHAGCIPDDDVARAASGEHHAAAARGLERGASVALVDEAFEIGGAPMTRHQVMAQHPVERLLAAGLHQPAEGAGRQAGERAVIGREQREGTLLALQGVEHPLAFRAATRVLWHLE